MKEVEIALLKNFSRRELTTAEKVRLVDQHSKECTGRAIIINDSSGFLATMSWPCPRQVPKQSPSPVEKILEEASGNLNLLEGPSDGGRWPGKQACAGLGRWLERQSQASSTLLAAGS